jgi:hypothetical protein
VVQLNLGMLNTLQVLPFSIDFYKVNVVCAHICVHLYGDQEFKTVKYPLGRKRLHSIS